MASKLKCKSVLLQEKVCSLPDAKRLVVNYEKCKTGLSMQTCTTYRLLSADDMLFSSETFLGRGNCFCWEDRVIWRFFFLTLEVNSKIRGRHKGELWHERKKRSRIFSLSWLWLFKSSLSSAGHTQTCRHRQKNVGLSGALDGHFSPLRQKPLLLNCSTKLPQTPHEDPPCEKEIVFLIFDVHSCSPKAQFGEQTCLKRRPKKRALNVMTMCDGMNMHPEKNNVSQR